MAILDKHYTKNPGITKKPQSKTMNPLRMGAANNSSA